MGIIETGVVALVGAILVVTVIYWVIRLAVRSAILDAHQQRDRDVARNEARRAPRP